MQAKEIMKLFTIAVFTALVACSKTESTSQSMAPLPASLLYFESHSEDGTKQLPPSVAADGIFKGYTLRTYRVRNSLGLIYQDEIIEKNGQVYVYSLKVPRELFRLAKSDSEVVKTLGILISSVYFTAHMSIDKEPKADSPEARLLPKFMDFAKEEAVEIGAGGSSSRIIEDSGMRVRAAPDSIIIDIFSEPTYVAVKASEVSVPAR